MGHKKIWAILLAVVLSLGLTACKQGGKANQPDATKSSSTASPAASPSPESKGQAVKSIRDLCKAMSLGEIRSLLGADDLKLKRDELYFGYPHCYYDNSPVSTIENYRAFIIGVDEDPDGSKFFDSLAKLGQSIPGLGDDAFRVANQVYVRHGRWIISCDVSLGNETQQIIAENRDAALMRLLISRLPRA